MSADCEMVPAERDRESLNFDHVVRRVIQELQRFGTRLAEPANEHVVREKVRKGLLAGMNVNGAGAVHENKSETSLVEQEASIIRFFGKYLESLVKSEVDDELSDVKAKEAEKRRRYLEDQAQALRDARRY